MKKTFEIILDKLRKKKIKGYVTPEKIPDLPKEEEREKSLAEIACEIFRAKIVTDESMMIFKDGKPKNESIYQLRPGSPIWIKL